MRENVMCFVRNLPYDCDDETLETTFSERFGPVKESWVVREGIDERAEALDTSSLPFRRTPGTRVGCLGRLRSGRGWWRW